MLLFTTIMLMVPSVGRIWWLARRARQVLGNKRIDRYYTVCAMILESGALYCAGAIAFLILGFQESFAHSNHGGTTAFATGAVLGQLVGTALTIIAVCVGLGKSVESVDSLVAKTEPGARGFCTLPRKW
ncbi:hypothetical protein K438DRAFT_349631 [Mycena galopus ATCC 62051]|nr:hypothetical protein K438DRAFT_349631 [Mycena galopus ATCC 62051]